MATSHNDVKLVCQQFTGLVDDIKTIYIKVLKGEISIACGSEEIRALLVEHEASRVPDKTNLVSLFPNGDLFIHLNQTYFSTSSSYEHLINLNFTLTPSPSGHKAVILIHPNVVVNDASIEYGSIRQVSKSLLSSFDLSPLQYVARPIFKGRDITHECIIKEHNIQWDLSRKLDKPIEIRVHPGDKLTFYATDNLDYTVTSCNNKYEIPLNPTYDLVLIDGHRAEIIIAVPGDYYFVSRPHKRQLKIYVHVKKCPHHVL